MKMRRFIALLLALVMVLSLAACGGNTDDKKDDATSTSGTDEGKKDDTADTGDTTDTGSDAADTSKTDPFGKYSEPVTIHLGGSLGANVTFPEGQSKEKNDYLDFIKEEFNIEIVYDWVCSASDFDTTMNLNIAGNELPDIMNVNATMYRSMLKYDQLQDITEAYNNCASDMLKSFVSSGGQPIQDLITVDGKMMAIPAPELIAGSVNTMWIRQDWLDKLGLPVPKNRDEVISTAKAFVDNNMSGDGNTIGIVGPANTGNLVGVGGNQFGLDPLFGSFKSYPKYWLKNDQGNVYYGSTTPETKEALAFLADAYKQGAIDPELLVRNDSAEPTLAGKVGIFFGPWWSGYTMVDMILAGSADWQAYASPLDDDGKFVAQMSAPTNQYIVVNKNCKYPEAAAKIINLLLRDEQKWIASGLKEKLNPSDAYPLFNVYDNANEIEVSYEALKGLLDGTVKKEDIDFSAHKLLENDMDVISVLKKEPLDDFGVENWDLTNELAGSNMGRMVSIMVGERPLVEEGYDTVYSLYYGQTDTMSSKWANLEAMEKEYFAKIIMGQASIDSFDEFVDRWTKEGGQDIINEISALIQ